MIRLIRTDECMNATEDDNKTQSIQSINTDFYSWRHMLRKSESEALSYLLIFFIVNSQVMNGIAGDDWVHFIYNKLQNNIHYDNYDQPEAQLSQRDRATHFVSWNLSNCYTTVRKSRFSFYSTFYGWLRCTVGRTSVSDRRTVPVARSTCSWRVTTYVGKPSAIDKPTGPTQSFILSGSINWVVCNFIGYVVVVPSGECSRG